MEKHFHREFESLKQQLMNMARKVQDMLKDTIDALVKLDKCAVEKVKVLEHEVNLQEIDIDSQCLKLIALYQPVGQDLRLLNIISKINNDLERLGDEAINICERVCRIIKDPKIDNENVLSKMEKMAIDMINKSIEGLEKNDASFSEEIFRMEETLDDLNKKLTISVIEQIKKRPDITDTALDIISISHRLERIGDIAVNITEDIIFFITGEDTRHPFDQKKQG